MNLQIVKQKKQSSMRIFPSFIKTSLFITLLLCSFQILDAQNIAVPAAKKLKTSPIVFNTAVIKEGKSVYEKNCLSCHGNPGKGNFLPAFVPPPADLATAKAQSQTDGELFYRTSEGNLIMPKFKTTLSEVERWKLVGYIRSFNKSYVQPPVVKSANLLTKTVQISIKYDSTTNKISMLTMSVIKNDTIRLKGSEELLFIKRLFGGLQIGTATKTNDKGIATFDYPKNLPGDKDGNIEFEARINDTVYGEIIKTQKLKIGVPTNISGLTEARAMWNVESKAPIWLLFTYFSILTGVWATIAYIIFYMFRLKKLGTKNKQ
jgi:mono/diheme cytochrome c family protein